MKNVRVLFPGREKLRRYRRGFRPNRAIIAPTYDEIVAMSHKENQILFTYTQVDKDMRSFFYLLKKEGAYGYLRLRELVDRPVVISCTSYDQLQDIFDDSKRNVVWRQTLPILINGLLHTKKISGHNIIFFEKIKEQFKEHFEEPPVVAAPLPGKVRVPIDAPYGSHWEDDLVD